MKMSEKERNLRIAESIYAQFAWNGHTFRDGDCVALLDGQIVAVADTPMTRSRHCVRSIRTPIAAWSSKSVIPWSMSFAESNRGHRLFSQP
jgi:hypothetical protein